VRLFNFLLFDEVMEGTPPYYSAPRFNDLLGAVDQLAFLLIADQVSGTSPSYDFYLEESADNVSWTQKNGFAAGTIEDLAMSLTAGTASSVTFRDAGTKPSLAFVRIKISLGGSDNRARLRIWVTGRALTAHAKSLGASGTC